MKKQKKILTQVLIFMTIILSCSQVFATNSVKSSSKMEFSEEFENYINLSEEERESLMIPRAYNVKTSKMTVTNPLKLARMLGSSLTAKYSLRNVIPENMVIKNQSPTNSCWTFSSLAALESTLALKDYKNGLTPVVYDFSEKHLEYATTKTFLNNEINQKGFNREIDQGGNFYIYIPYLTNGTGAISESSMKFITGEKPEKISLSELNNKTVVTQVDDILIFPSASTSAQIAQLKQLMKEHIKNNGAIDAGIHGASISLNSAVYNNETGAIYCNDAGKYPIDHAVAIVGWDDNYAVENFLEGNRPTSKGAWIIKNSWGTGEKYTLSEMKEIIFEQLQENCIQNGWTEANLIPDDVALELFVEIGYTINENNEAVLTLGDDGFMYVSYEDVNIYSQLTGITNAQYGTSYENIYQYDQYAGALPYTFESSKIYLATVFDKQTSVSEYLTQVSIYATETYTCKVYLNTNGTSTAKSDLQQVQLKSGTTETFDAGYHTIEFLNPIKIEGDKFVVVIEIQGTDANSVSAMMEFNPADYANKNQSLGAMQLAQALSIYNNVTVENGKCFATNEAGFNANQWDDTSTFYQLNEGACPDFDTTIKAFTTSKVLESIEVTTPPTKTTYVVGQDFDKSGMVVKANYANGDSIEITDYTITDGTDLATNQTSVTISYQGKTTTQSINVVENAVESIEITTPPTKTEYWAGDDFDATGMVVEAIYTDGTRETVTDYTITDGKALKNGQTAVTIKYEGLTVKQAITVKENAVVKLEVVENATKLNYVVGQNFDPTGLKIQATYENRNVKEVTDYTVQDGTNLQIGQTTVTIEYEGFTVTQEITVVEKDIIEITVKTMPTKTEYIQNKEELDLTGGVIEIAYNDDDKEEIDMTDELITVAGFDNTKLGKQTITVTYEGKTTQFDVEIKELPKPVNSNFDDMQGHVTRIRTYSYTDENKKGYVVLNVELSNIAKATENEEVKYYYYLSQNPNEENISDWVEIKEKQQTDTGLAFEINTLNVANYEELAEANSIYLYVKEVATRNEMKAEKITSAVLLEAGNAEIEEYVDGEKKEAAGTSTDSTPADKDDTKAPGSIPKAGKDILMVCLAIAIIVIGKISYSKYKDIQVK